MYESGIGVVKDASQALRWYRKAAEQGDSRAENNLAGLYEEGAVVPQDLEEAVKWYKLAAEQGNGNSYINLARLYAGARGYKPDYSLAYFWSLLAQRSPWPVFTGPSQRLIELLRSRLSTEQLTSAEAQAEDWADKHAPNAAPLDDLGEAWSLVVLPTSSSGQP